MTPTTKQEKMYMVMNGYNPLSPEDVANFRQGKKPVVGTAHQIESTGEYSFNSLGEKNMASITAQYKDPEFQETFQNELDDSSQFQDFNSKQESPRESVRNSMNTYERPA